MWLVVKYKNNELQILKNSLVNGVTKIIFASSAAVYGNPKHLPIKELDDVDPISPYGKHKLLAESLITKFYQDYKVAACSLRIFSVYGPGLKKQLLWDVYNKAMDAKGDSISLYGTGLESRDYIYIDDLLSAIDLVLKNGDFNGTIYNVASGVEVEIQKITKLLVSKLNKNINIQFNGVVKEGDPLNWLSDITRLKKMGYKSEVSIEVGVKRYVEWLEKK